MENTIGNEMKSENARMFINKQMQRKLSLFLKNVSRFWKQRSWNWNTLRSPQIQPSADLTVLEITTKLVPS